MSTFTVKLNNSAQGLLDLDPSTDPEAAGSTEIYGLLGTPMTTSKQRTIYVAGPHKTNRLLKDGETFVDCNYWKKFCEYNASTNPYGCDAASAFLSLTSDDGTVWSDVDAENTYGIGGSGTANSTGNQTDANTHYSTSSPYGINFMTTYGAPARFLQVQNLDGSNAIVLVLNSDANMTCTIAGLATQTFEIGDLMITHLLIKSASGAAYKWIAAVKTQPTS
jgi:hypothetical protein